MRRATLWKSLAGVTATFSMVLAGAGVAGAVPDKQPQPGQPGYGAPLNCATAEHAGFGVAYHQVDPSCSGFPS